MVSGGQTPALTTKGYKMTDSELIAEFSKRLYEGGWAFAEAAYKEANMITFGVGHYYVDDDGNILDDDDDNGTKLYDGDSMAQYITDLLNTFTGSDFYVVVDEN